MPQFAQLVYNKAGILRAEVCEDVSVKMAGVQKWRAVIASIDKDVGNATVSTPDHLVRNPIDVCRQRCKVLRHI